MRTSVLLFIVPILVFGGDRKPVTVDTLVDEKLRPARFTPIWAPDGNRFAFEEDKKIWIYDAPTGERRVVIEGEKLSKAAVGPEEDSAPFDWTNRNVREQSLQWFHAGDRMLVSSKGDLFVLDIAKGSFEQLTATPEEEHDPKISPDDKFISFRRAHDLYLMETASRKVTRLTRDGTESLRNGEADWVYPEELDLETAYWWAPDSKSIAYLQFDVSQEPIYPQANLLGHRGVAEPQRYPKAGEPNAEVRLGVIPVNGGVTRWMQLGDPRNSLLARVKWAPDSKQLAVVRLNRVQNELDLLFADAARGTPRTVLHEEDPFWINVVGSIEFVKGGQEFLWTSERDGGNRHIFLYQADGTQERQLTHGDWQVDNIKAVDEKGPDGKGRVFFTGTKDSPLGRHLYTVPLEGGEVARLDGPDGSSRVSIAPVTFHYMLTHSSLTAPAERTLFLAGGKPVTVKKADTKLLDDYTLLPTEIVKVNGADGTPLFAKMIKPAGFSADKKYPVIINVYGGPHAQSVTDSWPGVSWGQMMAQRGFVIWQLDNRGSFGRGHKFESAVFRNLGAVELADQKAGIAQLVAMGFVDPKRIGIWGWSYGGFMTLYSLINAPDLFRAGIAGAPVTDWRNYDSIYTERYMGLPAENKDGYESSTPIAHAHDVKANLLLLHNFSDDNVHFANTLQMAQALEKANQQFRMVIYPQRTHGVTQPYDKHLMQTMMEFFEEALK